MIYLIVENCYTGCEYARIREEMEGEKVKIRKAALALIVAASCVVTSGSMLPVWAEEPGETALDQGLEGYWNFDGTDPMENQGSNEDLAASLSGDAVSVQESSEEELGNVLHFGTRQGTSARMTIASALNSGSRDFSISLWINNSSSQNASAKTVILQQTGNGRTLLYRQNGQYVTYISAADVTMGSSTGADAWEHIVLVKTGSESAYRLTLYVNGEKANEHDLNSGAVNAVTDLLIGAHKNAGDTGQFVGDIDELRLYGRAVSEEEVQALYAEHEGIVLEQQLQGIKEELSALVSRAEEIYGQGLVDADAPEAVTLSAAIERASEALQGTDVTALTEAAAALEDALNAYIDSSLLLEISTEDVSRTVDDGIFGINHRYAFNGYGSFDPETMKVKDEFAELYSQAGFGSLRYPGGTISNLYNWKTAIGPVEDRVAQIHGFYNNPGQHGIAPNFGIDEVADFVQEYDSELVYVYALARGDADDAADLIEYLNAEVGSNPNGGTAWAEVRAANGHQEPYNVRYFEIGNEMNQGGADGTTAQTYWIDDVPGGALEGYMNGGTASFTRQYVVAEDDWNVSASYSDGSQNQEFCLRYARVERDEKADDYDSFTAVNKGSVRVYVGGEEWTEIENLDSADAGAQVYSVDYKTGTVYFGDGTHGAVPGNGLQITADYSVDRDGFVQISEAMRDTMEQINAYNSENGLQEKEIHIYSSYETENFVNRMHEEGHDSLYDGLTIHPYSGTPSGGSASEKSRETFYYDAMKKGDNKSAEVENYVALMQKYDETKVPVISEYGIFRSTDAMVRSQTHALYIARAIMEYVRLGSPYIQKHCLVDWYSEGADSLGPTQQAVIQAVSTGGSTADGTGEFRFFSTPSARVFEMLNSSFGDQIISALLNYEQQLDNGVNQYSVMTSKDEEGNVYAAIVNLNLEGENKIKLKIDDLDLTGKTMEIQSLSGETFYSENTLDDPDNVAIESSSEIITDKMPSVTLKPHSFTVVKIVDALVQEAPVDKDALQEAVAAAEALVEEDYTAESYAEVSTALEAARKVLEDENADQAAVDEALAKLSEAVENLVKAENPENPDPEPPETPGEKEPSGGSGQQQNPGRQEGGTPQTGDSIPFAAGMAMILSCSIIVLCFKRKRAK